jgi:hypothetical protein
MALTPITTGSARLAQMSPVESRSTGLLCERHQLPRLPAVLTGVTYRPTVAYGELERAAQVASTHATRHWHPSCSKSSRHSNSTELPGTSSRKPSPLTFEKWTKPRPGRAGVETAPQPSSLCQNATVPSDTGADRIFDLPAPVRCRQGDTDPLNLQGHSITLGVNTLPCPHTNPRRHAPLDYDVVKVGHLG